MSGIKSLESFANTHEGNDYNLLKLIDYDHACNKQSANM